MRISNLSAPNRCTPGGEFKNNTFSITLEMTAGELSLLTSALHWQQEGMGDHLESGALDSCFETKEHWHSTITTSKAIQDIFDAILNAIF